MSTLVTKPVDVFIRLCFGEILKPSVFADVLICIPFTVSASIYGVFSGFEAVEFAQLMAITTFLCAVLVLFSVALSDLSPLYRRSSGNILLTTLTVIATPMLLVGGTIHAWGVIFALLLPIPARPLQDLIEQVIDKLLDWISYPTPLYPLRRKGK